MQEARSEKACAGSFAIFNRTLERKARRYEVHTRSHTRRKNVIKSGARLTAYREHASLSDESSKVIEETEANQPFACSSFASGFLALQHIGHCKYP